MKRIILILIAFISVNVYAQQKGISYQAVILNPKGASAPGVDVANSPLTNKNVCMLFEIVDGSTQVEYQETIQTITDQFGMVNLVIGTGTKTGGYAANFSRINWAGGNKKLVVKINTSGNCSSYTEISNQPLMYAPYALFAETSSVNDGAITDAKIASGISPSKVGLGNVNNTSDANKPVSIATQSALDTKENLSNKSTSTALGTSDVLYPTQNAVKSYVDSKVLTGAKGDKGDTGATGAAGVNGLDGAKGEKGDKGDAGEKGDKGETGAAGVNGLDGAKGDTGEKGDKGDTGATGVNGLDGAKGEKGDKGDTGVAGRDGSLLADADAFTKGKIQLAGDLGGTADAPTVPALAVQGAAIALNTAKVGFTDSLVAISPAVLANSAKVGITTQQAIDILTNNAKVGYTDSLVAISPAVIANTAKVGYTDSLVAASPAVIAKQDVANLSKNVQADVADDDKYPSVKAIVTYVNALQAAGGVPPANTTTLGTIKLAGDLAGTADEPTIPALAVQAAAIALNTAKVGITAQQASDIMANNAKVGITTAQANAIIANTAKVGITPQQANDITTNNAKVGITAQQASDIVANNAKVGITTAQAAIIASTSGTNTGDQTTITGNAGSATNLQGGVAGSLPYQTAANTTTLLPKGTDGQVLTLTSGLPTWAAAAATGVPYTGASGAVNLGAYDLKVNGLTVGRGLGGAVSNTALGTDALKTNTTGTSNTALGYQALLSNTIGLSNVAIGDVALLNNLNGADNVAVGSDVLTANTSGEANVAIGTASLRKNTTSGHNVSVGYYALSENISGSRNNAFGSRSLRYNTGSDNNSFGEQALYSNSGAGNHAFGNGALYANTTGDNNVAFGYAAMGHKATGSQNVALGGMAGTKIADGSTNNTSADNSIFLGYAAYPQAISQTNQIVIGYNAIGNGSNTIQLGNTAITNVKTSGSITAGTVTYPNSHNSTAGQVLTTNAEGVTSWTSPAATISEIADEYTSTSGVGTAYLTAGKTSFDLTQSPSVNSKVKMYVNGIRISNTAYSISGSTLTYIPANNGGYALTLTDRIQFDYFH